MGGIQEKLCVCVCGGGADCCVNVLSEDLFGFNI